MKLYFIVFLIFSISAFSQNNATFSVLNNNSFYNSEKWIYENSDKARTSVKPVLYREFADSSKSDSIENKFFQKNLIEFRKNNTKIILNPVIGSIYYKGLNNNDINLNQAGLALNVNLFKNLSFFYSLVFNYTKFPFYSSNKIDSLNVIEGETTNFTKIGNYYSYFKQNAYISYSASEYINFQAGIDKNFWGDGYRSLFLSDNSSAFPFIKTTVTAWKVKYLIMYTFLKDIDSNKPTMGWNEKYASIHYLTWNVFKNMDINLFETVIWRGRDSLGYRGYDVNYLNPVVFYRPVDFSLASPDNVIMGAGGRLRILKHNHFYGQLVLDEFKLAEIKAKNGWWANKFGIQAGFKSYKFLWINNLFFLAEYNYVKPFTYSHGNSLENYGSSYQPLAHPLGANFKELIGILKYNFKKLSVEFKGIYAQKGFDTDSLNNGGNIYRSYDDNRHEYGNFILQGMKGSSKYAELKFSYLINPKWNSSFEAGVAYKSQKTPLYTYRNIYIFAGIRANLYNDYILQNL
ncbi:MAG: hypothetical protein A2046_07350 [Bacteroidetes bacterium GWA2_30_7]|nr:MAG: hypothetical protein A2046_07350 [Bacteroidetes bacterium GWA2_30_7]